MRIVALLLVVGLAASFASAQNAGRAHVHIYRPHYALFGIAAKPTVYFDRIRAGKIPNGRYFKIEVPPGKYTVRVDEMSLLAEHTVELEAGKDYYIRISFPITKSTIVGGTHLQIDMIPPDEALDAMKTLKPMKGSPYYLGISPELP